MSDKTKPGVTFSIPEIMDAIERKFEYYCGLTLDCYGGAYIVDQEGIPEVEFNNLAELHTWVAKTQAELDEAEAEQSAINDKINHDSANVDIFKQRF